jgi:hypothetical protein
MPTQEVLILAITKMLSGICTAGFSCDPAPTTGLCWIRPTREFGTVLPGDMTDEDRRLIQCSDVVALNLIEPRPDPPHVEDWITDFVYQRPRVVRKLEGERRAAFFPKYLDEAPEEVLCDHARSLCLVKPQELWAHFSLDPYSGRYETRMGFRLDCERQHPRAQSAHGCSVTDLKWRALGREWLGASGGEITLDAAGLADRLGADAFYLTVGLSRKWQGEYWPLVHAVHVVPDYTAAIDPDNL